MNMLLLIRAAMAQADPLYPIIEPEGQISGTVLLASKYGGVDPRSGSRTGRTCVSRSPLSVSMEVWIPEVALVQV